MDTNKRVLIAFAVSFAILIVWRALFVPPAPPPAPKAPAAPTKAGAGAVPEAPAVAKTPQAAKKAPPRVALPVQQGSQAQDIVIEGQDYRVTFSTQGGVVTSWILKDYRDENGKPLDVVNHAACEALGFPLSLRLADQELSGRLNKALFVSTPSGTSLTAPLKLELVYSDGKIRVRKQFEFASGYEIQAEVSVFDGQRYLPVQVAWPGGFGDQSVPERVKSSMDHVVYGTAEKIERIAQRKVDEDRTIPPPVQLAGLDDRYFVDIFLPQSPGEASFYFARRTWNPPDWKGKEPPKEAIVALGGDLPKPLAFHLFVAPKDLDLLRAVKPPLDGLVDFGWFSFVAKPLFLALRFIHDHWIHNYGWAIVLLTVFITMAMFPLKLKSIRSAQEMQRVAPLVKSIQDRYKNYKFNDPRKQRMNQEVMKLYQEHHINPLGGCLPMILQLPFLYGFYKVLDLSIELRHAPWFGWIQDLSAPDHLYILPTLMIVASFILQKMTPIATADPKQQRMMMIMPIFIGIMFYSFASGLVLYWLTSSVVGIAQQAFINRMIPAPQPIPVARKAASAKE
jgi:YidC/Oxa1 family membrane protein insertase